MSEPTERQAQTLTERIKAFGAARKGLKSDKAYIDACVPPAADYLLPENAHKSRYHSLLLLDDTRVYLDDQFYQKDPKVGDLVNASYVDGYDRANQYILAMGPGTEDQIELLWRMVVHERCSTLVLLSPLQTTRNVKLLACFWPKVGQAKTYCNGQLSVKTEGRGPSGCEAQSYAITVRVAGVAPHPLQLLHYQEWSSADDELPPRSLLQFSQKVRLIHEQVEASKGRQRPPSPLLLMCSTGVRRCGAYVALDISIRRVRAEGRVALPETVRVLRRQRFGCVWSSRQYMALFELLVAHCIQMGMLRVDDLPPDITALNLLRTNIIINPTRHVQVASQQQPISRRSLSGGRKASKASTSRKESSSRKGSQKGSSQTRGAAQMNSQAHPTQNRRATDNISNKK